MKSFIFLAALICFITTSHAATSPGLSYSYYEGTWNFLPNFNSLTPVKKGTSVNFDLSIKNRDLSYGIVWQGYVMIPTAGNYTFQTTSDDGSQLYINGSTIPLVDNDGIHAARSVSGAIYLEAGPYPIKVLFFQNSGSGSMEVYWSSNTGLALQKIPNSALSSDISSSEGLTGKRNFYFSSVTGDDSRSDAQAQNAATPWKSLSKLNSYFPNLQPGDAILFQRGETFDGSIEIAKSGSTGAPIIFSTYGSGNKPVINGLTTVSSWTSLGNNIYEAGLTGGGRVNMVTMNGEIKAMGRYPNSSFLSIDSRSDLTEGPTYTYSGSITDAQLTDFSANWTGAEVVIRINDYILDRCLITNHSANTISFRSPTSTPPTVNYGYFIQNSASTLDQQGEWFYNSSTQRLRIFSTVDPASLQVKAGTVKTLVSIDNKTDITFDNLVFEGADTSAFKITNESANITIQNCSFNYSGTEVLRGASSRHITFANNTTNHTNSYAIIMYGCSDVTVKNNVIKNTGMLAGMGLPNQQGYGGIFIQGGNTLIEGNVVDSVGSAGIAFNGGNNNVVKNNYVNYFCSIVGDGGGIYTNGNDGFTGKKIIGNIISNGIGIYQGTTSATPRAANGIYIDEGGSNVEILNNTVFNVISNGIYIHQSHELIVKGNTLFNNSGSQLAMVDDQPSANRIRNLDIKNNISFSKKTSQVVMYSSSVSDDLNQFGTFDSNYYSRPFDIGGIISTQYKISGGEVNSRFDLAGWKNKFAGRDNNSVSGPSLLSYSVSNVEANKVTGGSFDINTNCVVGDDNTTITLDTKLDGKAAKFTCKNPGIPDAGGLIPLGTVVAGKSYRIRFSLLGSTNTQNLISYVRRFNDPDYSIVSETKYFPLRTTRTECEYLYTATANEVNVKLTIIASGMMLPFWIDNIEVVPVDVEFKNIEDSVRFEYNNTGSVKTVSLDGEYVDSKSTKYSGSVNLDPYTSIILIKYNNATANQLPETRTGTATLPDSALAANASELKVYPSPAVSTLHTRLMNPSIGKTTLIIYNLSGLVVQTAEYVKTAVMLENSVNVSKLLPGVYYAEYIFSDHRSVMKTFVKQ